jgi:hypothetical protein
MIIENNAGGHTFRDRVCIRCRMTKEKFAESGYPQCKGTALDEVKRSAIALVKDSDGAA